MSKHIVDTMKAMLRAGARTAMRPIEGLGYSDDGRVERGGLREPGLLACSSWVGERGVLRAPRRYDERQHVPPRNEGNTNRMVHAWLHAHSMRKTHFLKTASAMPWTCAAVSMEFMGVCGAAGVSTRLWKPAEKEVFSRHGQATSKS